MNNPVPQFLEKAVTVPLFQNKSELNKCRSFRATCTWNAVCDLDLIAGVMRQSTLIAQPLSMIYQAGDENASTRTLKSGNDIIASLFADDIDGANNNEDKTMLEACVAKNQTMIEYGFDSIVFGLIGYNGNRLKTSDATITLSALDEAKNIITSKVIRVDNFDGNVAGIACAFYKNNQWYISTVCEDFGYGVKSSEQHQGLGLFWTKSQPFSARAFASEVNG